jgi:HAAS domain-containing protein
VTADLIEGYLDQLLGHLRGSAHDVRRILAEAEEHLRDAAAELVAAGASDEEAQRRAIERFGRPRTVARRFSARLAPVPPAAVAAELARAALPLGGVALVAIGASGLVAELLGRLLGAGFVAGDLPGMTYTPQRCAEFLEYFPDAGGCAQAAALHHWGEVVEYRVAVGALGLLVLGAFLLWRRGRGGRPPEYLGVLPDGFAATVATSLYGVAAAVFALEGLDALLVAGGDGAGQWLSAAVVALAMAVLYGVSLYRTVLNRARLGSATSKLGLAERSSS